MIYSSLGFITISLSISPDSGASFENAYYTFADIGGILLTIMIHVPLLGTSTQHA